VKNIAHRVFNGGKITPDYCRAGYQHDIPAPLDFRQHRFHAIPELSLDAVPCNRIAQRFPGNDADSGYFKLIRMYYQHKKRVGVGSSELPHPLEVTILV
jgi:hypothetical protein